MKGDGLAQAIRRADGLESDFERRPLVFFHPEGNRGIRLALGAKGEGAVEAGCWQDKVCSERAEIISRYFPCGVPCANTCALSSVWL